MAGHDRILPWPMAIDLNSQRNAEECAHQHEARQYDQIGDRRIDYERLDDVPGDQEFKAKEDAASEGGAKGNIGLRSIASRKRTSKHPAGIGRSDQDGEGAGQVQHDDGQMEKLAQPRRINGDHTTPGPGCC